MKCPSCGRPIAMARPTCVYCGAKLSVELLDEAASAARRVLQSRSLAGLEKAAKGASPDQVWRRYLILDTKDVSVESVAKACSASTWEARQWQAASRYRLLKVTTETDAPIESALRDRSLPFFALSEEVVAAARSPLLLEAVDSVSALLRVTFRAEADGRSQTRDIRNEDIAILLSAPIRREKVKEATASRRAQPETRLEDAWLMHLHLKDEPRPFELDPRRVAFEGGGLASAHMRSLELLRRLAADVPHDEAFKNTVPALSPGSDPLIDLASLKTPQKSGAKEAKLVVLDNVAQFREYSAWRGAVEKARRQGSAGPV
ncbi:MAG: hypothetical protein ABI672_09255 [Vicinamibacteria bacterium]